MAVYHILKDGTKVNDITGFVVKMSECKDTFEIIDQMRRRLSNEKRKTEKAV